MMEFLERWARGWSVKALFVYNRTETLFGREAAQANRILTARRKAAKARRAH